jgi:hypothetical protein
VQRTYLALAAAAVAAVAAAAASAAPSQPTLAKPWQPETLTALPLGTPPPLPEPVMAPASDNQAPRIVALQVIPFTP